MSEVERISVLKPVYGAEVELVGDEGESEPYHIIAEYRIGDQAYAGLQSVSMRKQDEVAFFRVLISEDTEPELESIEDEDEWETVAEAFDDLMFEGEEQP
ncbi:hypothetical protein Back11_06600 [Paenibacillus baekrokdamisoli]|uniref:Uncharacterized protein n=1 Tax=Paenibacillus baekrokdamisoli TaxID=1712516 RepID=A0A3G9ITD4_9BACL|nr:DUF1292 domain-containing protein [Paenibacillus baekrokdamisoli]MBB3067500.1 hypothetical protein [Paenibacillus baekrokdamisoli]BBH19315.1 hypothetical protein Back11_06600 [Paenibacillus baekrokdamisoli]